jgi:hypothetical protein
MRQADNRISRTFVKRTKDSALASDSALNALTITSDTFSNTKAGRRSKYPLQTNALIRARPTTGFSHTTYLAGNLVRYHTPPTSFPSNFPQLPHLYSSILHTYPFPTHPIITTLYLQPSPPNPSHPIQ